MYIALSFELSGISGLESTVFNVSSNASGLSNAVKVLLAIMFSYVNSLSCANCKANIKITVVFPLSLAILKLKNLKQSFLAFQVFFKI